MQAIGPFEIVGELGRGCLGVVYEAHTPRSSEPVAVKVPHEAVRSDPTSLERFRRHIATLAGLDHPNIVGFRDAGEDRGIPYLVMERLEGRDLAAVVGNRDAIPPSGKLKLLVRLARALEHVHAKNLVYLNLKTRHVRLLPEGGVKLIDFCLTAPVTPAGPSGGPAALAGTADFLAPEQIGGGLVDGRADLFGLGCLAYELLSGRRPFTGGSLHARLLELSHGSPPPLSELHDTPFAWLASSCAASRSSPTGASEGRET